MLLFCGAKLAKTYGYGNISPRFFLLEFKNSKEELT